MASVFVSIGSNIAPETHIRSALKALRGYFGVVECSSVYQSAAEGFDGPDFLNLVARFRTEMAPLSVIQVFKSIEQRHNRAPNSPSFSDRTLDLDLLLYDDWVVTEPGLELPRPEIEHYAFVLRPLAEMAPEKQHPVNHQSFQLMWKAFDKKEQQLLKKVDFKTE